MFKILYFLRLLNVSLKFILRLHKMYFFRDYGVFLLVLCLVKYNSGYILKTKYKWDYMDS